MAPFLRLRGFTLDLSRPQVMGVLNVTPDSFADGGRYFDARHAAQRVLDMLDIRISQTTTQIAALTRLRKELERRRAALARRPPRRGGRGYCTCLHKSK